MIVGILESLLGAKSNMLDMLQFDLCKQCCYRATAKSSSWERNVSTRQLFQELFWRNQLRMGRFLIARPDNFEVWHWEFNVSHAIFASIYSSSCQRSGETHDTRGWDSHGSNAEMHAVFGMHQRCRTVVKANQKVGCDQKVSVQDERKFRLRLCKEYTDKTQLMWLSGRPTLYVAEVGGSVPAKCQH